MSLSASLLKSEERTHPGGQQTEEVAKSEAWASKAVQLLREMRREGILPNELTYKPIMSWLPAKGRDAQFQELKKYMEEDRVDFTGVFKYYEIRLALRVGDIKKAERLYMQAKNEDEEFASSLDGEIIFYRPPVTNWSCLSWFSIVKGTEDSSS